GLLILIISIFAFVLIGGIRGFSPLSILAALLALGCGFVGFLDDFIKTLKARSLGLKARTKFIAQFIVSLCFTWMAIRYAALPTSVTLPATSISIELSVFYYLLVFLIVSATTNSVNLTDGLDGLAAGTVMVILMAYAAISFRQNHLDLAIFCASIGGACLGFLWHNVSPAEIFMGDTGSLGLGGAIAALAVLTKTEFLLVLIGGIYVIECLSVILQVISFRYFGTRLFKMAPIHHHFEMLGWSETKIMIRFWIITAVLAGAGFALYFVS
ncbi:MAG: phospho-N-acetylmuramoyl-pentapeptide-transferase, partial [Candidatus Subteraquimicrobiales bacterium]|nr:phospho-N-acetylmuramoyl-pentapeptide-transferase [Candidatus Subteraquimicrobiales bacterium]